MHEQPTLRVATAEDAAGIASLHLRSVFAAYSEILAADFLATLTLDSFVEQWHQRLGAQGSSPFTETMVAETQSQIVGFAYCDLSRDGGANDVAEVLALHVAPEQRQRGIGQALLETADSRLFARSASNILLWVFEQNWRARRFYERMGWRADRDTVENPPLHHGAPIVKYWRR
ncbi:MAG: GNAT family N-acetyltransferase [Candidatus Dormiibacterota bacterium]